MNTNVLPEKDFYPLDDELVEAFQEVTKPKKHTPGRRKVDFVPDYDVNHMYSVPLDTSKIEGDVNETSSSFHQKLGRAYRPADYGVESAMTEIVNDAKETFIASMFWGVIAAMIVAMIILN